MNTPQSVKWTREEIEQKVVAIIAEKLDVDRQRIRLDSVLMTDLPMDSLEMVEIAMTCEDEFEIKVLEEVKFQTVGDIVAYVASKTAEVKTA